MSYPKFAYYPRTRAPPPWVAELGLVFTDVRANIDTTTGNWNESDKVLEILRPGLEKIGYDVERGKKADEKIHRPVFFGDQGKPSMKYEIDAYHQEQGILLEVEAGRSWHGNAVYRDIVQMSLMVGGSYAAIAMPMDYKFGQLKKPSHPYELAKSMLDAVWGSERLKLPFEGMALLGY